MLVAFLYLTVLIAAARASACRDQGHGRLPLAPRAHVLSVQCPARQS